MQKREYKILLRIFVITGVAVACVMMMSTFVSRVVTTIVLNHEAMNYTSALRSAVAKTGFLPPPPIALEDRILLLKSSGQPVTPGERQYVFPILDEDLRWLFDVDTPNSQAAPLLVLIPNGLEGEYAVAIHASGPKLVSTDSAEEFSLEGRVLWTYGRDTFTLPEGMDRTEVSTYLLNRSRRSQGRTNQNRIPHKRNIGL